MNRLLVPLLPVISTAVKSQSPADGKILRAAIPSGPDGYKILNSDSGTGYAEIHYT